MLWALVVFTFPFSFLFSKILPCQGIRKRFQGIIEGYTYNTLLRALIESYLDLIISASINLTRLNLNNKTERISSSVTLLFTAVLFFLPFFILFKVSRPRHELLDKQVRDEVGMLYEDLNLSSPNAFVINYYTIFVFRRLLFGLLLVFATEEPRIQILLISGSSVVMLIWLVRARPMSNKKIQFLE